jgi:hypothetical protein
MVDVADFFFTIPIWVAEGMVPAPPPSYGVAQLCRRFDCDGLG